MEVKEIKSVRIWKNIKIGTFVDVNELKEAIYRMKDFISMGAKELMYSPDFKMSKDECEIRLIKKSVKDFGFRKVGTSLNEILKAAEAMGYKLCPAEAGPQLRWQYIDQLSGEKIHMAMKPIENSAGIPCLFSLLRYGDGEGLLHTLSFDPEKLFKLDACFVFCVDENVEL